MPAGMRLRGSGRARTRSGASRTSREHWLVIQNTRRPRPTRERPRAAEASVRDAGPPAWSGRSAGWTCLPGSWRVGPCKPTPRRGGRCPRCLMWSGGTVGGVTVPESPAPPCLSCGAGVAAAGREMVQSLLTPAVPFPAHCPWAWSLHCPCLESRGTRPADSVWVSSGR